MYNKKKWHNLKTSVLLLSSMYLYAVLCQVFTLAFLSFNSKLLFVNFVLHFMNLQTCVIMCILYHEEVPMQSEINYPKHTKLLYRVFNVSNIKTTPAFKLSAQPWLF